MNDFGSETYRPSDAEPFMNERQREYFRRKLIAWREVDPRRKPRHAERSATGKRKSPRHRRPSVVGNRPGDRARARDRQRKLISKIEAALGRIDEGSYGYCLETGEPISLRRLDARPIATLSVEAQERHERREKIYRDD